MTGSAYIDNDIFLKLVASDILEKALQAIGLLPQNVAVLERAKYVFRKTKRYPDAVINSAIEKLNQFPKVAADAEGESEVFFRLHQTFEIDVGEAILISRTYSHDDCLLITGDKRCLQALKNNPALQDIHANLQGRVICLEQIVKKTIETQGFSYVRQQSKFLASYDKALQIAFGYSLNNDRVQVVANLNSYIEELQRNSDNLLCNL